jgi:hypothetical protein
MDSLEYPWPETPPPGETIAVAPGIHWLSMPLPFQLDHINLWLVEDEGGWTVVDTGIGDHKTRALWEALFAKFHPVKRVILTHYHPDHAGNAEWICKRFGVEMWTTQGEYLTAHAVRASSAGYTSDAVLSVFKKNGLPADKTAAMAAIRGNNRYSALVPNFRSPTGASSRETRCASADATGRRSSAMATRRNTVPILQTAKCSDCGDMLLSTISTNVSVWSIDPEGDPLRLFLEIDRPLPQLAAGCPGTSVPWQAVSRARTCGCASSKSTTRRASPS